MPNLRLPYALALITLVTLLSAPALLQRPAVVHAQATAFRPNPIASSSPDVPGPLRGLYDFNIRQEAPIGSYDTYIRYSWRELEPSEGVYNFALIDDHLAEARANGKRHGFRVRAMSTGNGVLVPDYIKNRMELGWMGSNSTYVPDWNDPDFLAGFERLMNALGNRYRRHPDLAFIDIGGYGNWGEFHTGNYGDPPNAAQPATLANILRIVDAHTNAFDPNDIYGPRLIMMTDHPDALRHALSKSPRIGWRRDSLGYSSFTDSGSFEQSMTEPLRAILFANRWKTAPVVTEFIAPTKATYPGTFTLAQQHVRDYHVSMVSNGNTAAWDSLDSTSRQAMLQAGKLAGYRFELDELAINGTLAPGGNIQVTARWENTGNAPAYEPYRAFFQLRSGGRVLFEAPLYANFETLLPTGGSPSIAADNLTLPSNIGGGTYDVHVQIRDIRGYRGPLPLAIEGRQADGSYRLGQLTLSGSPISLPPINLPSPTCSTRQYYGDGSGRYGQITETNYIAGTTFTLTEQSSTVARGLVVTAADNESQLSAIGATFTVLSPGAFVVGLYSHNNNTSAQWVKMRTCVPPSGGISPTPTFTPAPAAPVATHTPTPTVNPCPVVRYYGDGSGQYGQTNRDSYQAGTTLTLMARSSSAVRAVYWITDQTPSFLEQVGSQATINTATNWNLGFESRTRNVSSEWVDVRLCPPGTSGGNPPPQSTPTRTATSVPVTPGAGACTTQRYYGDTSGTIGQLTKLRYPGGTVFSLTARSSSAVSGILWIDNQATISLPQVGSSYTTRYVYTYNLGFQSSTANRTSEWVDIRTCLPATSTSAPYQPAGDQVIYLPLVIDSMALTPSDSPIEIEGALSGQSAGEPGAENVEEAGSLDPTPTSTATAGAGDTLDPTPTSTPPASPPAP